MLEKKRNEKPHKHVPQSRQVFFLILFQVHAHQFVETFFF